MGLLVGWADYVIDGEFSEVPPDPPPYKVELCDRLCELGYQARIVRAGNGYPLIAVEQDGLIHYLCTDEAEKLLKVKQHPVSLIDCLVHCEGAQWYEFKSPLKEDH